MKNLEEVFRVNAVGPAAVTQALLRNLCAGKRRTIVNLSSGLGSISENDSGGWISYRASKAALNQLTRTIAAELKKDRFICIALCPGWVRTDMGGPAAPRSVEQGADTIVWLATLPPAGPTGGFFRDRSLISW